MNRKNVIIISIVFLLIFIFSGYNFLHGKNKIELDENSDLISIWVEDSSGNYQSANTYPGAGYILNLSLSQCENGGTLSGDGTHVYLEAGYSDKCYLYFSTPWVNANATKTLTCNNSAKTWDYKINGASFSVSTDADLTCTATKTAASTSTSFAQYIASLAGTTQGDGKVINENGYRFEGKAPNNYIWFNNELWRIIGVFGSSRHGVTNDPRTINSVSDTYLVKIIRNESIGSYGWDGDFSYTNNATNSTIIALLNDCYYDSERGNDWVISREDNGGEMTEFTACANYCSFYNTDNSELVTRYSCDFSGIGIKQDDFFYNYSELIQKANWYLGGPGKSGYTTYYPSNIYSYETNANAVYSGNPTYINENIGLIYLSDYGYAVLASDCARGSYTMNSNSTTGYSINACFGKNWLKGVFGQWTITPNSSNTTGAFRVSNTGEVSSTYVYSQSPGVFPVLYLKSNTYKITGDGSITNPYVVGMI